MDFREKTRRKPENNLEQRTLVRWIEVYFSAAPLFEGPCGQSVIEMGMRHKNSRKLESKILQPAANTLAFRPRIYNDRPSAFLIAEQVTVGLEHANDQAL
jgi:hypothetical protein